MMMAADLDQAYTRWAHEELSDPTRPPHEKSIAQMLDHGSISFGRFAIDSLSWEKRSVFTHNRRQEELEQFKAPGLVAQKKAYFEEYYRKIRALKALAGDGQQAGDVMDAGSDDVHSQMAEDEGCESELTSMNSMNEDSTASHEKFSYVNCGKQEKNAITDFRCLDPEAATSSSNCFDKSVDEIELETNSSNVSQITYLDSDSMPPYILQPKMNEAELENRSSNVSQITQIDTDSVVQYLDQSDANINDTGVVHLKIESNSDFQSKVEENHLVHDKSGGKELTENEKHTAVCETHTAEAISAHPSVHSGVYSQLRDVGHKASEPNDSGFITGLKHAPDPHQDQTKKIMRPSNEKLKKSTTASIMNQVSGNRPGSSRSLRGFNIQQECGTLATNKVNHGPIKRPGSSRSHRGFRDQQESGTSAINNMNQGHLNRPGSSRSHQGLANRQESASSARNNMKLGLSNQLGLSRTLQGFSNQQVSGTMARDNMNQGPSVSSRPGSSRSLQGLNNRPGSSKSIQGFNNRPGSSKSLQRPKNLLPKTSEDRKIASSSNINRMEESDASPCTISKDVHSKVTIPRPFNFATEKRLTTERRMTDTPHQGDQHSNSYNNIARRLGTPSQTRSFSSSLNTPKNAATELCGKEKTVEYRHQEIPQKSSMLESQLTVKGDGHLRQPVNRSINFPASEISDSIGKHNSGGGNGTRLNQKEEKPAKTPSGKSKQIYKDGESMIRTPKSEIRKVVSSQPAHAATVKKTPRQEVKRWR